MKNLISLLLVLITPVYGWGGVSHLDVIRGVTELRLSPTRGEGGKKLLNFLDFINGSGF